MSRMLFAIVNGLKHRKAIKQLAKNAYPSIAEINYQQMIDEGIKVLVFDFDGVLAAHGKIAIKDSLRPVITKALELFPDRVVILSNKPMQQRIDWLKEQYPTIDFFVAKKKKPYPDGLLGIIGKYQIKPHEVTLVDDRLLTGCLASTLANTHFCYINKAKADFKNNFVKEAGFYCLRLFEKCFV